MTVGELIEVLAALPEDTEVCVQTDPGGVEVLTTSDVQVWLGTGPNHAAGNVISIYSEEDAPENAEEIVVISPWV